MNKHICGMTRQEFLDVPERKDCDDPIYCYHFIIIPTDEFSKERSPMSCIYKNMIIIAADEHCKPICRINESDILWLYDAHRWRIDCLPASSLICIDTDDPIKIKGRNELSVYSNMDMKKLIKM
jgi:hypothetical protein